MPGVRDAIAGHLVSVYPAEGCGALVGSIAGNLIQISRAVPIANVNTVRAEDRYMLDPRSYASLERELADKRDGTQIVGFFHSHPHAPAVPSHIDLEDARGLYEFTQAQYVYAILRTDQGRAGELRFWVLEDGGFTELSAAEGC